MHKFLQRFNGGQNIGQYANLQNPLKNQFTYISSFGTHRSSIVNGVLRFNKTGASSAQLDRAIKLDDNCTYSYQTYDFSQIVNKSKINPTDHQTVYSGKSSHAISFQTVQSSCIVYSRAIHPFS